LIEVSVKDCVKYVRKWRSIWEFFVPNILINKKEKIPGMNGGSWEYSDPLPAAGVYVRFEVL
jgi:hypothetical protein